MTSFRLLALLCLVSLSACSATNPVDAGPRDGGPIDAGATDAGPELDPTAAAFVPASTSALGPWALWGFSAVALSQNEAIVYGGTDAGDGTTTYGDVWRVQIGADHALSATAIEASGPAPRYCGCMAYDAARDTLIVYGGRDLSGPTPAGADVTWELALSSATWTERAAGGPPGTLGCAMAYSPRNETTYLFGGANRSGAYDRIHRYDPANGSWVELPADGPVPRYDAVLLADGERLLMFGGSYGGSGAAFYADLWSFDLVDETWTEIVMPEGPPGRRTAWVVRDPERAGLYVGFGYDGAMNPLGDLYYADLSARTWTRLALPAEGPSPRGFAPALPGGPGALGTLVGGNGGTRGLDESWRLVR